MPKIYPEMIELGRPPRLEPDLRRGAAFGAMACLCRLLNAMLDERFPERVASPGDLAARVAEAHAAFFEEASFLFEIAECRGLKEEPTQSIRDAFALLVGSETVHNVKGGHEPWEEWYTVHLGDVNVPSLFDERNANVVNPGGDPAIAEMFARARNFLHRIELIIKCEEEVISTSIMDLMPEAVRLSLEGAAACGKEEADTDPDPAVEPEPQVAPEPQAEPEPQVETESQAVDNEKAVFQRPWMLVTEGYAVYRHHLAKAFGLSNRTLTNYEKDGKTPAGTFWPSPLNSGFASVKKYYDPIKVLEALTALPKGFRKRIRVDEMIAALMGGELSSKIPVMVPKKPKKETEEEELAREMDAIGWQSENQTWEPGTMTRKNRPD